MTEQARYKVMYEKYGRMIEDAQQEHNMFRSRRTAERLEYLKGRQKRFKI